MQAVLNGKQLREWSWSWARRLHDDITLTASWLKEVRAMCGESPDYEAALTWAVCAYFEYLKGRWKQPHADAQLNEATKILQKLG